MPLRGSLNVRCQKSDHCDRVGNGHIKFSGWLNFSITLRARRHSIDTEASATLKGRRGFRVDAVTPRGADLVVLGGFLMYPTTTNMNIVAGCLVDSLCEMMTTTAATSLKSVLVFPEPAVSPKSPPHLHAYAHRFGAIRINECQAVRREIMHTRGDTHSMLLSIANNHRTDVKLNAAIFYRLTVHALIVSIFWKLCSILNERSLCFPYCRY